MNKDEEEAIYLLLKCIFAGILVMILIAMAF